jgi:hypothetical protein
MPRKIVDAAPDLSGLDVAGLHGLAIVEILIDERGDVKAACLLRGVREDVDLRVMAAIRQWRFVPVRLRHRTLPDEPASLVTTVALQIGRAAQGSHLDPGAIARGHRFESRRTRSGTSNE